MDIIHVSDLKWQTPVITEKLAYDCLKKQPLKFKNYNPRKPIAYLAVPWATIIDNLLWGGDEGKLSAEETLKKISKLKKNRNYITVCQHYQYNIMLPAFSKIGGSTIFSPHAPLTGRISSKLTIEPFPLYSANVSDSAQDKNVLYSFIGAYKEKYLSKIREQIFEDDHPDDAVIVKRDDWQFNETVYTEQLNNERLTNVQKYIIHEKAQYYKRILGKSRFSLCPSGAGPSSIRFFESLASGSIPVVLADTLALPKVNDIDWDECIIRIPEYKYNQLRDILGDISDKKEKKMRRNCLKAYKLLSGKNFVQCIRDYYE